jgi:hypothetical protein
VYAWIWKKIPGGLAGRLAGSLALTVGMFALLWFVVFPAVRPHMPWSNVQLDGNDDGPAVVDPSGGPDGADTTCVPGVNCQDPDFDPEDYETARQEDVEGEGGDG